jgi:hypothetical protein
MVSGPDYDDQDLEEQYDDGYGDESDDDVDAMAELNILNCMIQLCQVLIKDITDEANPGVLAYGGLALKRHSDILINLIEDRIMMDMIKKSEEEGEND